MEPAEMNTDNCTADPSLEIVNLECGICVQLFSSSVFICGLDFKL